MVNVATRLSLDYDLADLYDDCAKFLEVDVVRAVDAGAGNRAHKERG